LVDSRRQPLVIKQREYQFIPLSVGCCLDPQMMTAATVISTDTGKKKSKFDAILFY
jgi:hypothetical protein